MGNRLDRDVNVVSIDDTGGYIKLKLKLNTQGVSLKPQVLAKILTIYIAKPLNYNVFYDDMKFSLNSGTHVQVFRYGNDLFIQNCARVWKVHVVNPSIIYQYDVL